MFSGSRERVRWEQGGLSNAENEPAVGNESVDILT